jgi:Na+/H+ antiporter NhaD/arsenite permease-like protein
MNFVTAPLIADLFLLAILAIGKKEVHDGTIGGDNIAPIDIMAFFLTLAYIAISIDASGLIRYLAFKVLQRGGEVGHRLFFYLYAFFFGLGSFIGNDPIILSGTAFLAYMTRVSSNIVHPRAWIHTQFAIANVASAILVSSNPTNLVLAGAFNIKFIEYTANMIVPVVVTAIVLFPFLLYIVFADETLIPFSIKMHELSEEAKAKKPVNPNIPHARGNLEDEENIVDNEQEKLLSLEEIMNPFLDKGGAAFGAVIMAATLVTVLALNAASQRGAEQPVYWVTLPAAFVMFCWDLAFGWYHRHETREIARKGREEVERARIERAIREAEHAEVLALYDEKTFATGPLATQIQSQDSQLHQQRNETACDNEYNIDDEIKPVVGASKKPPHPKFQSVSNASRFSPDNNEALTTPGPSPLLDSSIAMLVPPSEPERTTSMDENLEKASVDSLPPGVLEANLSGEVDEKKRALAERISKEVAFRHERGPTTLIMLVTDAYIWLQETFPTVMAVVMHLPFALVPFAFTMFVLVQALVTKGWVDVFAHGWDHWVNRTGTVGSIGGMGFISVILCNVSLIFPRKCTQKIPQHSELKSTSLRVQILGQQSFSPGSFNPGSIFTKSIILP